MNTTKQYLQQAKRIVIKIGSSLLLDDNGKINQEWLHSFIEDIKHYRKLGKEIILVCSGSVALGLKNLKLNSGYLPLPEQQAAAAIGQIKLAYAYQQALAKADLVGAQLLLTLDNSDNRQRYLNTCNTLETLITQGIIPFINENDTVSTTELKIGDNDRLAARVAQMVNANILVFFSDIDGLYDSDPHLEPTAKLIECVDKIDSSIEKLAGASHSKLGSGGMATKIMAAKIATASGCHLVITKGHASNPLQKLAQGGKCTWFVSSVSPQSAHKKWLAHQLKPKGQLQIDPGAAAALQKGNSLLASGISAVSGHFNKGDAVQITNKEQQVIGVGLVNYPQSDLTKILGQHSLALENILGYSNGASVIHRNHMVLT